MFALVQEKGEHVYYSKYARVWHTHTKTICVFAGQSNFIEKVVTIIRILTASHGDF